MRSSVQDLFHPGIPSADTGSTPLADRVERAGQGPRRAGEPGDTVSFDAVLALAAALAAAAPTPIRNQPQPIAVDVQQRSSDLVGPRAELDPETTPFSLPSRAHFTGAFEADDVASLAGPPGALEPSTEFDSRNLFQLFAGISGATDGQRDTDEELAVPTPVMNAELGTDPAPDVDGSGQKLIAPAGAATNIPLDFRAVTRRVPVSTEARPATGTSDRAPAQADAGLDTPRLRWRDESRLPEGRLPRFGTPIDDGGLIVPELRVVARNDNPTPAPIRAIAQPNLRLIDFQAEAAPRPSDDLAARLAGSWEQSFGAGGTDAPGGAPVLTLAPTALARGRDLAGWHFAGAEKPAAEVAEILEFSRPEQAANGDTEPVEAGAEPRPAGDDEPRDAVPEFDQPELSHPAVSGNAEDAPARHSMVTPVSLFDELLAVDAQSAAPFEAEPVVSVRQAALEIANEVRHLQRTGGSELVFNLRLHPEHLGQVEVAIQRVDNVWSISIIAANDEARDALAAEIGRLEQRFRESNLTLDGVNVVTKTSDEAITAPTAGERASDANLRGGDQQGFWGDENRDQSGWRNNPSSRILGFDSHADAETAQVLTDRHAPASGTGIDIQA